MSRKRRPQKERKSVGVKGSDKRYPMPCPECRRMIDARDKLCPHCGVDTNVKLAGAYVVAAWLVLLAVVGLLWGTGVIGETWATTIVGVALGLSIPGWVKRRRAK